VNGERMVRVLLDACVPHWLRHELSGLEVETAQFAGLNHCSDSELLTAIDGRFNALVTLDRNLNFQQRIEGRSLAVVVLGVSEQTPEEFAAVVPFLIAAIAEIRPGQLRVISSSGNPS